jgi:hypothetical protein
MDGRKEGKVPAVALRETAVGKVPSCCLPPSLLAWPPSLPIDRCTGPSQAAFQRHSCFVADDLPPPSPNF